MVTTWQLRDFPDYATHHLDGLLLGHNAKNPQKIIMNQIRWNVAVSRDTDQSLRTFLASQGGGGKGELSRFIEEAVRAHILELTAEQVKAANTSVSEGELSAIVEEAVQWSRSH